MNEVKKKNYESGVALLFALGVLSLLMILGLAFVTNSMLGQRVAANVNHRGQATLLAKSAFSRVAACIASYSLQNSNYTPSDFSFIHSHDKTVKTHDDSTDGITDAIITKAKKTDDTDTESVTLDDSVLDVYVNSTRYYGRDSQASWMFFRNPQGILTGRIAYWVLPPVSPSKMDIRHAFQGYYVDPNKHFGARPYNYRLGNSVNELFLDFGGASSKRTPLYWWPSDDTPATLAKFNEKKSDDTYKYEFTRDDILSSYSTYFPEDPSANKKWLLRWFAQPALETVLSESGGNMTSSSTYNHEMEMDVYAYYAGNNTMGMDRGDTKFLRRFNLGQQQTNWDNMTVNKILMYDGDDDLIGDETKVNKLLLFNSAGRPQDFDDTKIGIPFFRKLCSEAGTFSSIETRRKQIVANLIDYCDTNDVPTSDVAPSSWDVSNSQNMPSYTGNEKTAYINEIALGASVTTSVKASTSSGQAAGYNTVLNLKVTPELIAELVNVYQKETKNYKLEAQIKNVKITFDVKAKITIKRRGKITGKEKTPITIEPSLTGCTYSYLSSDSPAKVSLDINAENKSCYALGGVFFGEKNDSADNGCDCDFSKKVEDELVNIGEWSLYELTGVEIGEISVKVTSASFEVGAVKLADGSNGVDFVRSLPELSAEASSDIYLFKDTPTDSSYVAIENTVSGTANKNKNKNNRFYLVGLEVLDPRQNLHSDDWTTCNKKLVAYNGPTKDNDQWKSFRVEPTEEDFPARLKVNIVDDEVVVGGLVNTVSNPKKPVDTENNLLESGFDVETVTDPGWQSDTAHLSTAFIRNHRMASLWELGLIHRGKAWETINLKAAKSILHPGQSISPSDHTPFWDVSRQQGTSYSGGDAGLLDEVKLTELSDGEHSDWTFGKVDVNMLSEKYPYYIPEDKRTGEALFRNLKYNQWVGNTGALCTADDNNNDNKASRVTAYNLTTDGSQTIGQSLAQNIAEYIFAHNHDSSNAANSLESRAAFVDWRPESTKGLYNGFGLVSVANNDAAQEELIGKTVNLLKTVATPPEVTQVVVVAQTIKDVGTETNKDTNGFFKKEAEKGKGTDIVKLSSNATPISLSCRQGVWDCYMTKPKERAIKTKAEYIYFDEITGEVKLLLTLKWDPVNKKVSLLQTEYIE